MGKRIPESLRSEVMRRREQGESRNKIAATLGISQGAVSGIFKDSKRSGGGVSVAEQQRDSCTAMNRQGISVVEGFRIERILKNMGVNADKVESFLVETYNRCIAIGLSPKAIAFRFSDFISSDTCKNFGTGIQKSGWGPGIDIDNDNDDDGDNDNDNDKDGGSGDSNVSHPIACILQIAKYLEKLKQEIKESELKTEKDLVQAKKSATMKKTPEEVPKKHHLMKRSADMIQSSLPDHRTSGDDGKEGQPLQQDNDFKLLSLPSSSSVKPSTYPSLSASTAKESTEDARTSPTRRGPEVRSATPPPPPIVYLLYPSSEPTEILSQKQDAHIRNDKSYQPTDMTLERSKNNHDQAHPTLSWTPSKGCQCDSIITAELTYDEPTIFLNYQLKYEGKGERN